MIESKTCTTMKLLTPAECEQVKLSDLINDETFQGIRFPKTNDGSKIIALLFAETWPVNEIKPTCEN